MNVHVVRSVQPLNMQKRCVSPVEPETENRSKRVIAAFDEPDGALSTWAARSRCRCSAQLRCSTDQVLNDDMGPSSMDMARPVPSNDQCEDGVSFKPMRSRIVGIPRREWLCDASDVWYRFILEEPMRWRRFEGNGEWDLFYVLRGSCDDSEVIAQR